MKISKGGFFYEEGDQVDNIYFLIKGDVSFVIPEFDHAQLPFLIFSGGHYFGEYEVVMKSRQRCFTAKAETDVEVLAIGLQEMLSLPENLKTEMNEMFHNTESKIQIINRLKKSAEQKLKHKTEFCPQYYDRRIMSIQNTDHNLNSNDKNTKKRSMCKKHIHHMHKYWKLLKNSLHKLQKVLSFSASGSAFGLESGSDRGSSVSSSEEIDQVGSLEGRLIGNHSDSVGGKLCNQGLGSKNQGNFLSIGKTQNLRKVVS